MITVLSLRFPTAATLSDSSDSKCRFWAALKAPQRQNGALQPGFLVPGAKFGPCYRKRVGGVLARAEPKTERGVQMAARVRKAVFPVAGLGTRFLPATKAMPKEMLTVVDRPLIQHVVDEAREAGIEHFIFVTGRNKGVIEDHFDRQFELEEVLVARGKKNELEGLNDDLPGPGTTSFTRQQEPLGLGHAVWCARELVGNEPFALLLPDVLVQTPGKGCLAQMLDVYDMHGGNIIAVAPVAEDQV